MCFGHKIQECVWAFCHKNNRGSSRLRSPAESQIDSESNKHTRQHCDLESWICWITFPDWTAVILELLHFTRTRVHLKEKPLSPSIISPLQLCACELMFLESYLYFPFTYFLFSVCGSFWANAPTTENITYVKNAQYCCSKTDWRSTGILTHSHFCPQEILKGLL